MNYPQVSVLIPMYNGENGIRKTLNSILEQTYPNFEIIVVDDGSTDESAVIVRSEYPQVFLIQQENQGISSALNTGLEYCQGQFIARIDCNDEAYSTRLESQVNFLIENPDIGLVGGHVMIYEKDETDVGVCKYPTTPQKTVKELLRRNPSVLHEAAMVRRSVIDEVGIYDPFYNGREDFELWTRISLISKMTNLDELVTRSLSTTEGISFMGINLTPLIELALLEREERKIKGIHWKNQILRQKYAQKLTPLRNRDLTTQEINSNKATLFSRRAAFILRSGGRKNAIKEYKRTIKHAPFNFKGWVGLLMALFVPLVFIKGIFELYYFIRDFQFRLRVKNFT